VKTHLLVQIAYPLLAFSPKICNFQYYFLTTKQLTKINFTHLKLTDSNVDFQKFPG